MAEDTKGLSLVDYVRKQRRKDCAVCALPTEIREQIASASDKKIKRPIVLAWLEHAHGIKLDLAAVSAHAAGHHDS